MGRSKIRKPHETKSVIKDHLEKNASVNALSDDECFVFSFKHLDKNQGSNFSDWQTNQMLAPALETLAGYCNRPVNQQLNNDKFTVYGDFPKKTAFYHPSHIPLDAKWARIHVNGLHVLAGHIFRNTFYIVFLDHDHTFYITEKKNT